MLEKLEPLSRIANQNGQDRKAYTNAIKALLQTYIGGLTPEQLDAMSPEDITRTLGGVNVDTEQSTSRTLLQMQDRNIVKDSEFKDITQKFANKYKGLKGIMDRDYKFQTTYDNLRYYWIPVEDLP